MESLQDHQVEKGSNLMNEIQAERKELPIYEFKNEIVDVIKNNLFCVITGETGSGKSTQIAQYIIDNMTIKDFKQYTNQEIFSMLSAQINLPEQSNNKKSSNQISGIDRNHDSTSSNKLVKVVVTQPRRVAAIQMAKRVSYERQTSLGREVGYSIRFDDCTDSKGRTQIKYVTDGILVRECLLDPDLNEYSVVVLDEAHERSLNTDILFALVKQAVLRRRGQLRLVVTSATLKTDQIAKYYFAFVKEENSQLIDQNQSSQLKQQQQQQYYGCPVLSVSGRCFPVSILHQDSPKEQRVETSVQIAIRIHLNEPSGDILVFLTGFEECEQATKKCFEKLSNIAERKQVPPMMIVPLYGSQTAEQQANAFLKTPENCRKIIFATNIAETSLTVANIGYVIDSGFVKQKIYNSSTGMESLQIVPISKVQAIQRAGRAGRTREGKCVRLYTEKFYKEQMPDSTVPEIKRVNLTGTVLTLKSMGINDVIEFDYLDSPDLDTIEHALKTLYYLEAINKHGELTNLGEELSKFPLEPTYTKSLFAYHQLAYNYRSHEDMLSLVSLLSAENIWVGVSRHDEGKLDRLEEVKRKFSDKQSDHMSLVNVFEEWQTLPRHKQDDWCFKNFIQARALKQAKNIKEQLIDYLSKVNWESIRKLLPKSQQQNEKGDRNKLSYEDRCRLLRKSLCQGFYMNTSRRVPHNTIEGSYLTVNEGLMVRTDRQSNFSLNKHYPDWVIYTDISSSANGSAGMMRMVSEIKLSWVEDNLPKLKEIDVKQLCGRATQNSDNGKSNLGKRSGKDGDEQTDDINKQESKEMTKEEKLRELQDRFKKRQKK
eukprot:403348600